MAAGTGGNIATYFQIDEPVKPTTVSTPSLRGGPGGVLHLLGGPLPDALGVAVAPDPVRQDRRGAARRSGRRRPPGPTRWLEIAKTCRSYLSRIARLAVDVASSSASARSTSKWSPQQAISSPS